VHSAACRSLEAVLNKVLALQLELCLPRLVSSPAPGGSIDGLRAFSRNPGRRASNIILLRFGVAYLRPTSRGTARKSPEF